MFYCDWRWLKLINRQSQTKYRYPDSKPPSPKNGELRVMYMQYCGVLNDNESIGIPAVYAIAISTDTRHDNRPVTAHKSIYKQAKDRKFLQASTTVRIPISTWNEDRNRFLVRSETIDGTVQKVVSTSLQPRLSHHSHCPTLVGLLQ